MILCCTSFANLMYELPLTRDVQIPYTRYSEIARCNLKILHHIIRQSNIAWKVETQNLMKGNGKHGYKI